MPRKEELESRLLAVLNRKPTEYPLAYGDPANCFGTYDGSKPGCQKCSQLEPENCQACMELTVIHGECQAYAEIEKEELKCEIDGCTDKLFSAGYCRKHYNQIRAGKAKRAPEPKTVEPVSESEFITVEIKIRKSDFQRLIK